MGIFYKTEHIDPATGGLWRVEFYPAEFDFQASADAGSIELDRRTFVIEEVTLGDFEHGVAIGLSKANSARISVALDIKQPNLDADGVAEFASRVLNPVQPKSHFALKTQLSRALYEREHTGDDTYVYADGVKMGDNIKKYNIFHLVLTIEEAVIVDFWGVQEAYSGKLVLGGDNIIAVELQEVCGFVLNTLPFKAIYGLILEDAGRAIDKTIFGIGSGARFVGDGLFFGWKGGNIWWSKCCAHYLCVRQDAGWTWDGKGKNNIYGAIFSYPVQCKADVSWAGHRWELYVPSGGQWPIETKSLLYGGDNKEAPQSKAAFGWVSLAGLYTVLEVVINDHLRVLCGAGAVELPKPDAKYYMQKYDNSGGIGAELPLDNLWFKAYERQGDGIYSYAANHNQTSEIYEMLDYVTVADFLQD